MHRNSHWLLRSHLLRRHHHGLAWHRSSHLGHRGLICGSWHLTWLLLVVSSRALGSSLPELPVVVVMSLLHVLTSKLLDKHVDNLNNLWIVQEFSVDCSRLRSLKSLEVSLVSCFFLLELSNFLKFVMVDVELLAIECVHVELLSGKSSIIRRFVANEGIESLTFLREKLHAFDITILREETLKFFFSGIGREVFDIEIASLLGVLESELISTFLLISISFLKSFSCINLHAFVLLLVLLFNCTGSCSWAGKFIIRI